MVVSVALRHRVLVPSRRLGGGGGGTRSAAACTTKNSQQQWPVVVRRFHYTYSSPGFYGKEDDDEQHSHGSNNHNHHHNNHHHHHSHSPPRNYRQRGFTVGIGGPVGSGKTALVLQLCRALPPLMTATTATTMTMMHHPLGVVTNDIFTQEDAEFLVRHNALPAHRIRAVETGGCPHAAIREDVSSNLTALEELTWSSYTTTTTTNSTSNNDNTNPHVPSSQPQQQPPLLLCESGGDNLAANFSRELADLTLYVIDVAGGDKVPRKGGPGITQSDLLIINKIDLADAVGADLEIMRRDALRMRTTTIHNNNHTNNNNNNNNNNNDHDDNSSSSSGRSSNNTTTVGPILFAAVKHGKGVPEICDFILQHYRSAMTTFQENEEEQQIPQ